MSVEICCFNNALNTHLLFRYTDLENQVQIHRSKAEQVREQKARVADAKKTTVDDLTRGLVNYKYLGFDFVKSGNGLRYVSLYPSHEMHVLEKREKLTPLRTDSPLRSLMRVIPIALLASPWWPTRKMPTKYTTAMHWTRRRSTCWWGSSTNLMICRPLCYKCVAPFLILFTKRVAVLLGYFDIILDSVKGTKSIGFSKRTCTTVGSCCDTFHG